MVLALAGPCSAQTPAMYPISFPCLLLSMHTRFPAALHLGHSEAGRLRLSSLTRAAMYPRTRLWLPWMSIVRLFFLASHLVRILLLANPRRAVPPAQVRLFTIPVLSRSLRLRTCDCLRTSRVTVAPGCHRTPYPPRLMLLVRDRQL